MESPIQGPSDYSLIPVQGPSPRTRRNRRGGAFQLSENQPEAPRDEASDQPAEHDVEQLHVGPRAQDEAGTRLDVTA